MSTEKQTSLRRMSSSDVSQIVRSLNRWASGELGSELSWNKIVQESGFSRQSLNANLQIKAAFGVAKESLRRGLASERVQAVENNFELVAENKRLRAELQGYEKQVDAWRARWQRIAYNLRSNGIQVVRVDSPIPAGAKRPTLSETDSILKKYDQEIPPA